MVQAPRNCTSDLAYDLGCSLEALSRRQNSGELSIRDHRPCV